MGGWGGGGEREKKEKEFEESSFQELNKSQS